MGPIHQRPVPSTGLYRTLPDSCEDLLYMYHRIALSSRGSEIGTVLLLRYLCLPILHVVTQRIMLLLLSILAIDISLT